MQKIRTPALKGMRFNRFVTESYKNTNTVRSDEAQRSRVRLPAARRARLRCGGGGLPARRACDQQARRHRCADQAEPGRRHEPARLPLLAVIRTGHGRRRQPLVGERGGALRVIQGELNVGPLLACAVIRRRFSSGCESHPANAPAGSNRSSHGGNEMAEAFG